MRREATDAEKKLWQLLRERRLGDFKFRRQAPVGGFVLDFYCMKAGIAVEADGGQHLGPDELEDDKRRSDALARLGICVLRFPDDEILKFPKAVREAIYAALVGEASPPPSAGVPGEGVSPSPASIRPP